MLLMAERLGASDYVPNMCVCSDSMYDGPAVIQWCTCCVCSGVEPAGGWSHLQQLLGLLQGSHGLLAAQKVPNGCSHLILRLLQQVAAAAAAGGLQLDVPCALPDSQASQEAADFPSQQQPGRPHDTTYISLMFDVG